MAGDWKMKLGIGQWIWKGVVELWQDCGCCSAQPWPGQQDLLQGGEGLHASNASALLSALIPSGAWLVERGRAWSRERNPSREDRPCPG